MSSLTLEACEVLLNLTASPPTLPTPFLPPPPPPSPPCVDRPFEPSIVLCLGLSALGGALEVASTMCLAYPAYRKKLGKVYTATEEKLLVVANLLIMLLASGAYIVGSWFGPVSLAVPTIMVSKLLVNLIIMGVILRMDTFSKEQQVGTYCITCAIITLPEIGPSDQDCLNAETLLFQPAAIAWILLLFVVTVGCILGMVTLPRRKKEPPMVVSLLVYVACQVVSAVINASASKLLVLLTNRADLLAISYVLILVCAAVNVISLILAAKTVDQGLFIPLTTSFTLLTNMTTGLIVWEDWRVISEWVSYVMVHCIMVLGIVLLTPHDVIEQFRNRERAETFTEVRKSFEQFTHRSSKTIAPDGTPGSEASRREKSRQMSRSASRTSRWTGHETSEGMTRAERVSHSRAPTLSDVILDATVVEPFDLSPPNDSAAGAGRPGAVKAQVQAEAVDGQREVSGHTKV